MRSRTTRSFWGAFARLPEERQTEARDAFRRWREDPFHPSLHFKFLASTDRLVSARVGRKWRVLGVQQGDEVVWFWIGPHHEYDKLIGRL